MSKSNVSSTLLKTLSSPRLCYPDSTLGTWAFTIRSSDQVQVDVQTQWIQKVSDKFHTFSLT